MGMPRIDKKISKNYFQPFLKNLQKLRLNLFNGFRKRLGLILPSSGKHVGQILFREHTHTHDGTAFVKFTRNFPRFTS